MNPRRAVAKLTPKVSSLSFSVSGGKQYILLPEDVAFAMAKIEDPGAGLLVEVKWAANERAVWPLILELQKAAGHLAMKKGWRVPPGTLEGMVLLALQESEVIRQRGKTKTGVPIYKPGAAKCPWCKGRGYRLLRSKPEVCDGCEGSTKQHWSTRACADALGVSQLDWKHFWADRYLDVRAILLGWEHDALKVVRKRLG